MVQQCKITYTRDKLLSLLDEAKALINIGRKELALDRLSEFYSFVDSSCKQNYPLIGMYTVLCNMARG